MYRCSTLLGLLNVFLLTPSYTRDKRIIVDRQKHNGTSWSEKGSNAMALLVQLKVNNQWDNFLD
jgi:hypothetical protein